MADYSQTQIRAMQQDAVRRVHEMQRIAREKVGTGPQEFSSSDRPLEERPHTQRHQRLPANIPIREPEPEVRREEHREEKLAESGGLSGFFEKLHLSDETIMVGLLLLILIGEGADIMLIMALVFILL